MREGFLLTEPRAFMWSSRGRHWIDDVAVNERVYELARDGRLHEARAAWLQDMEDGI